MCVYTQVVAKHYFQSNIQRSQNFTLFKLVIRVPDIKILLSNFQQHASVFLSVSVLINKNMCVRIYMCVCIIYIYI